MTIANDVARESETGRSCSRIEIVGHDYRVSICIVNQLWQNHTYERTPVADDQNEQTGQQSTVGTV